MTTRSGSAIAGPRIVPPPRGCRFTVGVWNFIKDRPSLILTLVVALSASSAVAAQRGATAAEEQAKREAFAEARALEQAGFLKAALLGTLNADAGSWFIRWGAAASGWKREKGSGAAPLLAYGVLFDCLSRLVGVQTPGVIGEMAEPNYFSMAAKRPERALKEFDAALKIDSGLIEARLRAARIRAPKDPKAARDLESIAMDPTVLPFSYLAAVSRAEVARGQDDVARAVLWYKKALEIQPRSTAATIALNSLQPGAALSIDGLDAKDSVLLLIRASSSLHALTPFCRNECRKWC